MCPPTEYQQRGDYPNTYLAVLAAESPGSGQVLTRRLAGMGLAATGRSSVRHALSAMEANGLVEVARPSCLPMAAAPHLLPHRRRHPVGERCGPRRTTFPGRL